MTNAKVQPALSHPPFQILFSVTIGNFLQLAGLVVGGWLMILAAHMDMREFLSDVLAVFGWLMIYLCSHALGHWVVGRWVGIRFQGYGLSGTDHLEGIGPGMRKSISLLQRLALITEEASMERAGRVAKALMFGAGETTSIVFMILAGLYAWQSNIPGGQILLVLSIAVSLSASISSLKLPEGDYAKAGRALRGN